jgi:DNA polymerase III sliding clamp (beta) subunit (PCNA family)
VTILEARVGDLAKSLAFNTEIVDARAAARNSHVAAGSIAAADGWLAITTSDAARQVTTRTRALGGLDDIGVSFNTTRLAGWLHHHDDDAPVTLEFQDNTMTARCGRARATLQTVNSSPARLALGASTMFTLNDKDRRRLITKPAAVVSIDEARYYLHGVSLRVANHRLVATATDGNRLVRTSIAMSSNTAEPSSQGIIIPKPTCDIISKLQAPLEVRLNDKLIEISAPGITVVSKLIDGNFPDCNRIISPPAESAAEIDADALISALQRLQAVTAETKLPPLAGLQWAPGDDGVRLELTHPGVAEDLVPGRVRGQARAAVPIGQFAGLLKVIGTDRITIDVAPGGVPLRISSPDDDDVLAVQFAVRWGLE